MIYTLTLNPSLDYLVRLDQLQLGKVNRVSYERVVPGGKGLNVSIVLANLGHKSHALGFVAGFTGLEIERCISAKGITCDFIHVSEGLSRINVKVKAQEESEINGRGPAITNNDIAALFKKLDQIHEGDVLIIAGSVPSTLPSNIYVRVLEHLYGHGIEFAIDAQGKLLTQVLAYRPFIIKPNHHELGEIFDVELSTRDEVIPYAQRLQALGGRNILVSLASEGAVFLGEDGSILMSEPPRGNVVSSVGAGDSMLAGFLAAWIETKDLEQAFRFGLCSGSASAFSPDLAMRSEVEALLETM